jgi:cytochrome c2
VRRRELAEEVLHDVMASHDVSRVYSYEDLADADGALGIVWSAQTLDAWLADPERLIPGQRMNYSVPQAADRADLIAYLKAKSGMPLLK